MQRTADCPWAVLGLDEGATLGQVRRAYRAKAKVAHPDCGGDRAGFEALKAAFDAVRPLAAVDPAPVTHRRPHRLARVYAWCDQPGPPPPVPFPPRPGPPSPPDPRPRPPPAALPFA